MNLDFTDLQRRNAPGHRHHREFHEAGYYIFGLYQIRADGSCGCEYPDCKNIGKHPIRAGWQHPLRLDEEQFDNGEAAGQFKTGYGVLTRGLLVIDVDAKNGGVDSFKLLMDKLPELATCGFVVDTGSGGGSQHWYFKYTGDKALRQMHDEYPGIDFKSTGYVVGPGSKHKSGNTYDVVLGAVADITDAPESLLELLAKPETIRVHDDDRAVDLTHDELREMLFSIPNDLYYDDWIAVGMALNDTLEGDGFDLFNEWSKRSDKYDEYTTQYKWRSFKPGGGYGFATLKWHAIQAGWEEPVTFSGNSDLGKPQAGESPLNLSGVDLRRPPGFVGQLAEWINDQCGKPREELAVGAAIAAIGSIANNNFEDSLPRKATANVFMICVAGSGTGKGDILGAVNDIYDAAGLIRFTYGKTKSSQEIYRNLIFDPRCLLNVDELGIRLASIANATKSGTSYNETWFGDMMSLYSAAGKIYPLSGDQAREIERVLTAKLADVQAAFDGNEMTPEEALPLIEKLKRQIERPVLEYPFLSMIGHTTPETIAPVITPERVREGFLSRTFLVYEPIDNPREKTSFNPGPLPEGLKTGIRGIAHPWAAHKVEIRTTSEARQALLALREYFHNMGDEMETSNGMHAVSTRGVELVAKLSFILGIPGRVRTLEHVQWATAYVIRDLEQKIHMAMGNSEQDDALLHKIMGILGNHPEGMAAGALKHKVGGRKKISEADLRTALDKLVATGHLRSFEREHPKNKRKAEYFISTKMKSDERY